MPDDRYERLSAQDAAFLAAEGPHTPMHVGAVFIADSGPLRTREGGVDVERIRDFIGGRLHRIPRYRQVLHYTPVRGSPVWVDDRHFNIEFHVRHTSLPQPGSAEQLKRLAGRVMSHALDQIGRASCRERV